MPNAERDLGAAAERAERQCAELEQRLKAAEADETETVTKLAEALAAGTSGRPISQLADARDRAEVRVMSARKDVDAARIGAKAARGAAETARLEVAVAALSGELAGAARALEATVATLAEQSAAWEEVVAKSRALGKERAVHERRFQVRIAAPTAGDAGLTSNLYSLARHAASELETLAAVRHEAAHPAPPPPNAPRPFFIAGDSPRAVRQRQTLAESAAAKPRAVMGR
jgi:hypothetical protein